MSLVNVLLKTLIIKYCIYADVFTEKKNRVAQIPVNLILHYENKPIQVYWKFYNQKIENFQIKILIFFLFLLKNTDCGYSLEPPRRGLYKSGV